MVENEAVELMHACFRTLHAAAAIFYLHTQRRVKSISAPTARPSAHSSEPPTPAPCTAQRLPLPHHLAAMDEAPLVGVNLGPLSAMGTIYSPAPAASAIAGY